MFTSISCAPFSTCLARHGEAFLVVAREDEARKGA